MPSAYVHLTPVGDTIDHVASIYCPCGIVAEYFWDGAVYTHPALDGRMSEQG